MKIFSKFMLVFGLVVISVVVAVEWVMFTRLKNEHQLLVAELVSLKSEEAQPRRDQGSPGISKAEQEELLRLRNEAAQLRIQKAGLERLRGQNQELKASLDSERDDPQTRWRLRVSQLRTNEMSYADFPGIVPEMAEALTNGDPAIRSDAAKVLRRIGIARLMDADLTPQNLADLKSAAKAAVPGLLPALKDPDPLVCANAAITLGLLHEDADQVVPALMENLNSDQWRISGSAAQALGRLQGDARSAVPALLQLAQSSGPNLRASAIDALKQIDPTAARNAGF